jgi:hypothetical protein
MDSDEKLSCGILKNLFLSPKNYAIVSGVSNPVKKKYSPKASC